MNVAAVVSTTLAAVGLPYSRNHHRYCCFGFLFWSSYSFWKRKRKISMSGISDFLPPSASISTDSSAGTTSTEPQAVPKPNQHQQWLIVGLGNPGRIFRGSRHNVGFEMLDALAEANGISVTSVSFKALVGKGFIYNVPVMLAKPQTFMNLSGGSVGDIVSYYEIPLKQVLVIFDDLDLPFAKLRLLPKGGHGGQNGMRSIIDHFNGSHDFPRLRIGIGRPPGKTYPFNFVLRQFSKQEREELDFTFERGVEAVRILLLEGFNKAATYVNSARPVE